MNKKLSHKKGTSHNPNTVIATSLKQQSEITCTYDSRNRKINNQDSLYFFRDIFLAQILVKNIWCQVSDRQHNLVRSDIAKHPSDKQEIENFY